MLQWGLTREGEEGIALTQAMHWSSVALQWGLTREGEEGCLQYISRIVWMEHRFNGASPVRARKGAFSCSVSGPGLALQWGLTREGEEGPSRKELIHEALNGFNGASPVRARKGP